MKLQQGLTLLVASLYAGHAGAATPYSCPAPGGEAVTVSAATVGGPAATISVPVVGDVDGLCTLVRRNATTGLQRAPVARSYGASGRGWEKSAGLFSSPASGLSVDCSAGTSCDVTLPPLTGLGEEYVLESFHRTLEADATAARFLEQATFGSTREDIDSLVASSNNFESWVADQIALPVSSLREFYRKRVNPKFEFSSVHGAVGSGPCDLHSRWRTYAIANKDQIRDRIGAVQAKYLTVEQVAGVPGYVWKVDGQIRTVSADAPAAADGTALPLDTRLKILNEQGRAALSDCVGCTILVSVSGESKEVANPPVSIAGLEGVVPLDVIDLPAFQSADLLSIESAEDYPLFAQWIPAGENALLNTTSLEGSCDGIDFRNPLPQSHSDAPGGTFPSIFARSTDAVSGEEVVFLYDRHLTLYENTVEKPLSDGGGSLVLDTFDTPAGAGVTCSNVAPDFYNEDSCVLSYEATACAPGASPKEVIVLDGATIESVGNITSRSLLVLSGLTISSEVVGSTGVSAPCSGGRREQFSRWQKVEDPVCENTADLGPGTYKLFQDLIEETPHFNDYNADLVTVSKKHARCDVEDEGKAVMGQVALADGTCWAHVHISEGEVYDLTEVEEGLITVEGIVATVNSTETWLVYAANYTSVGTLGDHITINAHTPYPLNDPEVVAAHRTLEYNPGNRPVLVCGSPDEIASDPFEGDHGFDGVVTEYDGWHSRGPIELAGQRSTVWTALAMNAADQLRQKMAWSLSQIVSVGMPGPGLEYQHTESYVTFFDMFVNSGFGNYRRLMKEYSFSYIMAARWLTYEDNRSLQYNLDKAGYEHYPDENYAREIMQLFTVGISQLEADGSVILREDGGPKHSYTQDDIMSYSRAWTGFVKRPQRGGAFTAGGGAGENSLDPLMIDVRTRDLLPKTDLEGGFVGDRVALCADLAGTKHHLRKGATYNLLGATGVPQKHMDEPLWTLDPDFKHIELDSSSPLYATLCGANAEGTCILPSKVVLDANLVYDATAMLGAEYAVDTVRSVKMKIGSTAVWYEYVRQPCVELSYYSDPKKVIRIGNKDYATATTMCANPAMEVASPMCSEAGWETTYNKNVIPCRYQGERLSYHASVSLCEENGLEQSFPLDIRTYQMEVCNDGLTTGEYFFWANSDCGLSVKVALESGQVAIVHSPSANADGSPATTESIVSADSINFFMVPWDETGPPTSSDCLNTPSCYLEGEYCICGTDTTETAVYSSAAEVSSVDGLMSSLFIGAVDPATFDAGTYSDLGDCGISGVTVYSTGGDCSSFAMDTVFAFEWKSKQMYLKNVKSMVSISGSTHQFRNPAQFMSLTDPEARDAYHETEAVLDSLFYHPAHPPFFASRLIQRFGTSNPTPGFVERVASAYATGSYGQFGSGEYGDLAALVAAILLDEESRAVVLDADQSSGQLREPLIKVLSFFRSSGLQYKSPLSFNTLMATEQKIGQGAFEIPSVFSFFLPEFSPPGEVRQAGLVAPESMVLQGDKVMFLLDALYNVVKFGVSDCHDVPSFDVWPHYPFDCPSVEGDSSSSPASLAYSPPAGATVDDIIDELGLLLTAGRLQASNRALIKSVVEPMMGDVAKAVRAAQQLVLSTPEYHSTELPRKGNTVREVTEYTVEPNSDAYKAVVVFLMKGGVDSWNMLVPKGGCSTSDAYAEYVTARGEGHAIPSEDLTSIFTSGQDCAEFGLNENFPLLADLYNEGQALFMANTGVLSQPLTKHDNWLSQTEQPFNHNFMLQTFFSGDINDTRAGTGVMGRILDELKQNGFQTSANNVVHGASMLSGDPLYGNRVLTVSTNPPKALNQYPTVDNLIDVVKTLNGVGESGNGIMSERWSYSVAAGLSDHELMLDISSNPDFDVASFPGLTGSLPRQFQAVASFMKSRQYRKVNRDVFVVAQGGYDMHGFDDLAVHFQAANDALGAFIQELKDQNLWNNTVIVMGSDFGRSMNANSNGGTDHAWGGNYFMAGGSVKGGQIVGSIPSPLGPESDYWLGRGRWIPTTPWESVWNAVAQWAGVHTDAALDSALPNRGSFATCDLFTDQDLFNDGTCECVEQDGVQSTLCDAVTYAPTGVPTVSPTKEPTNTPTASPTVVLPTDGVMVKSIVTKGDPLTNFGCNDANKLPLAIDGKTNKYVCSRSGLLSEPTGIIFNSRPSIATHLRIYANEQCNGCDPVSYILEGRESASSEWTLIDQGDLPWATTPSGRNPQFLTIASSYESADPNLNSTEVHLKSNNVGYVDYKITFPETRNPSSSTLRFAEIELPGMLLPTEAPTASPVRPTEAPTASPIQFGVTSSPTVSGLPVNQILDSGSSITSVNCVNPRRDQKAVNGNCDKYICDRVGLTSLTPEIIFSPAHGMSSIAKALRFYTQNGCDRCDPVTFVLEGRVDASSPWNVIAQDDLPWKTAGYGVIGRNAGSAVVSSTFESPDTSLVHNEVTFASNEDAYLEYKLKLTPRRGVQRYLQFGEVELPGILLT